MQSLMKGEPDKLKEIPKAQCKPLGKPLNFYVEAFPNSKEGMKKAYGTGDYTMQQIADAFGCNIPLSAERSIKLRSKVHDCKTWPYFLRAIALSPH